MERICQRAICLDQEQMEIDHSVQRLRNVHLNLRVEMAARQIGQFSAHGRCKNHLLCRDQRILRRTENRGTGLTTEITSKEKKRLCQGQQARQKPCKITGEQQQKKGQNVSVLSLFYYCLSRSSERKVRGDEQTIGYAGDCDLLDGIHVSWYTKLLFTVMWDKCYVKTLFPWRVSKYFCKKGKCEW